VRASFLLLYELLVFELTISLNGRATGIGILTTGRK
jgi:hypothetical protein